MSILPFLLDDLDLMRPVKRPRKMRSLDDLEPSSSALMIVPKSIFEFPDYMKNLSAALEDKDTTVSVDKNKFQANFDVQHFKPEEICVKVSEDKRTVTIEAKHEEKQDEHGQIYRHFVRKYTLPKDCDINHVESKLSSDGVLAITAPIIGRKRKHEEQHRDIRIIQTGKPAKTVESKPKNENMETN